MVKLLGNIQAEFLEIDSALKAFNQEIAANLTQATITSKLPALNTLLAQKLKEIKVNLAAFDMAINIQKIEQIDDESREAIKSSKVVVETTHAGLVKNINQLKTVRNNSPAMGSALADLLKNMGEWEFLLRKHLEQYDVILNKLEA